MRGPIDYIIVEFKGNNFTGEVIDELAKAVKSKTIAVLDLSLITKDADGAVAAIELTDMQDAGMAEFVKENNIEAGLITTDDVEEVAEMMDNDCSVGLLVIEQLWAIGLKKAIINAGGALVAEGRIHPEAAEELNNEKGE